MSHRPGRSWPAPAKLNLFLHVTGRRDDGYHDLQTVFQLLDYGDEIDLAVRGDGRIRRVSALPGVDADDDLTVRAARQLQRVTGCRRGVDIAVRKRLPMGSGLGGGSSDAATTLIALNRLWGLDLEVAALAEMGRALGADVPVFVHGHTAWAEGVGDRLEPLALPARWYLVLLPPCHVATAALFGNPELTRNSRPIKIEDFLSGDATNDFEAIVRALHPEVDEALRLLSLSAPARMSGTGSSVFAAFGSEREARAAWPAGWSGFVAKGVATSPLLDRLRAEPERT